MVLAMLLIHLSDIHFNKDWCNAPADPERPYRTALLNHARRQARQIGPVDAVLVTGDIAYQGHPDEYHAAQQWLEELCEAVQCDLEGLFVVPGNHDVDRAVIASRQSVKNTLTMISEASDKERSLYEQMRDPEAGPALFAPLASYNEFAAPYECQVYPKKLSWAADLPLEHGYTLRLHGLTSTLLSGLPGHDDRPGRLYLSRLQTAWDREELVVNAVLAHHPPEWLNDHERADERFCNGARLHFFGHKHRQRIYREKDWVRFAAGAVNPDYRETAWEPGYNTVRLEVRQHGGSYSLEVQAHLWRWQTNPDLFVPKMENDSSNVFAHRIVLEQNVALSPPPQDEAPSVTSVMGGPSNKHTPEAPMSTDKRRNLVQRFWALPDSQKRSIVDQLALLEPHELALPVPERYGRALVRAGERGLLDRLLTSLEESEQL